MKAFKNILPLRKVYRQPGVENRLFFPLLIWGKQIGLCSTKFLREHNRFKSSPKAIFSKTRMLSAAILFLWGATGHAATYAIDPAHSRMGFVVKHLMVTDVHGQFNEYEGTVEYDSANPGETKINVIINADSIDTAEAKRDEHLRGADFFKTDEFPTITFKATGVNKTDSNYVIVGDLTIKGVTKTISISSQMAGPIKHPFGGEVVAITGETVVNRQDFGVSWNKALDSGGLLVGDDVRLIINVEAKKEDLAENK